MLEQRFFEQKFARKRILNFNLMARECLVIDSISVGEIAELL